MHQQAVPPVPAVHAITVERPGFGELHEHAALLLAGECEESGGDSNRNAKQRADADAPQARRIPRCHGKPREDHESHRRAHAADLERSSLLRREAPLRKLGGVRDRPAEKQEGGAKGGGPHDDAERGTHQAPPHQTEN